MLHHQALCCHGTPEHVLGDHVSLADLGNNTLLDSLPHSGYTNKNGWLELADVASAVSDRVVGNGLWVTVTHGTAPVQACVLKNKFENVSERKVGQETVTRAKIRTDNDIDTSDC